jgi:hypothetical protein
MPAVDVVWNGLKSQSAGDDEAEQDGEYAHSIDDGPDATGDCILYPAMNRRWLSLVVFVKCSVCSSLWYGRYLSSFVPPQQQQQLQHKDLVVLWGKYLLCQERYGGNEILFWFILAKNK